MITIRQIEKEYGKRIPRKFRVHLESYINIPEVQEYLEKALSSDISDSDHKWLMKYGCHPDQRPLSNHPGLYEPKYPGLKYICVTFIHPITRWQALAEKLDRLCKELEEV